MKINKIGCAEKVRFDSLESGEYFIYDDLLYRKMSNRQDSRYYSAVSFGVYVRCASYGQNVRPHTLVQKVKINSICVKLCE